MEGSSKTDDAHGNDIGGSMSQTGGAGDGSPNKRRKKGLAKARFSSATPSLRAERRSGELSATPGRTSPTPGAHSYTTVARHVTDVTDVYKGPPGAAFTTLRFVNVDKFKAKLQELREISRHRSLQRIRLETILFTQTEQIQHIEVSQKDSKSSQADSAIDVGTPGFDINPVVDTIELHTTDTVTMAPVRELSQADKDRLRERNQQVETVSDSLKDVIHNFYEVQAQVQGYVSEAETRDVLVNKMTELSQSLARLARESSSNTITNTFVPPEVVDYVDDGRNPDIYTRELVEVVQRGNAVLNGKMNAFGSFSEIFANDLRNMSPEIAKAVDEIMSSSGDGVHVKQENGASQP